MSRHRPVAAPLVAFRAGVAGVAVVAVLAVVALLALLATRAGHRPAATTLARPAALPDAALTAAVPAATASGPAVATGPPPATASAPPATPAAVRAALAALDRVRAAAYTAPGAADPGAWALPTCACHAEDVRRLRDLARAHLALRGHVVTLTAVTVLSARAGPAGFLRVEAVATDRVASYAAVDPAGRVVRRWAATGPRRWRITLERTSGRWRYAAVARAP
jgi:hypothetical protein